MILDEEKISHVNTIDHDGKVLVFGVDPEGHVHYTVKRSGFEDSAVEEDADPFGFEPWKPLRLGESLPDPSVTAEERKTWPGPGDMPLRTVYGDSDEVTKCTGGPVQLVSSQNQLYVFRRSPSGKILVNRFVLDGMTNELVPKLEVRFRRSRQRLTPHTASGPSGGEDFDNLDYRDIDGNYFYEGAIELGFAGNIDDAAFSVVLVPTSEMDRSRWHLMSIFSGRLMLISAGGGPDGLFDVTDHLYAQRDPADPSGTVFRSIPGSILRGFLLEDSDGTPLRAAGGVSATTYDLQREQITPNGPKLVRDATRVMVAVPVWVHGASVSTAALSFGVAADGTLSVISEQPYVSETRGGRVRAVLTPVALLDQIDAIGAESAAGSGRIAGTARGDDALLQVRSETPISPDVKTEAHVAIHGTKSHDGHYVVRDVNGSTFAIDGPGDEPPATWEILPDKRSGLVYDGMIVGIEKDATGRLVVRCAEHDLEVGQEVQISGTTDVDGVYPIVAVSPFTDSFTIDVPYFTARAANLSRIVRRGMHMSGSDLVATPGLALSAPPRGKSFGRTFSAWVRAEQADRRQTLIADSTGLMRLSLNESGAAEIAVRFGRFRDFVSLVDPAPTPPGSGWVHLSGSIEYTSADGGATRITLCKNGVLADEKTVLGAPPASGVTRSMSFDGTRDFIEVPPFPTPRTALAVSVLARSATDEWNDHGCLVSKRGSFMLHPWRGSTRVDFTVWIGGKQVTVTANAKDIREWHHYAGTYDGKAVVLYIDGEEKDRAPATGPVDEDPDGAMYIGHDRGYAETERNFRGELAEVQLWSKPRVSVDADFADDEDGLAGYWPLAAGAADSTMNGRHGRIYGAPHITSNDFDCKIGAGFVGEIADAQIWGVTRPPSEVKATMRVRLGGKEEGLAAAYPLGAIVTESDPPTVLDISVNHRDAAVHGAPYAGARSLERATVSGKKVVEYSSDELVAVSGRGTYEETFELRIEGPPGVSFDPNDIDGAGNPIFSFAYWGKTSREGKEIIRFPASVVQQARFEPIGGGFYKASCRVTVPERVALMRAFGVSNVRGRWGSEAAPPPNEWRSISVRRHALRFVSGAMTFQIFEEHVRVPTLPGQDGSLDAILTEVRRLDAMVPVAEGVVADARARIDVLQYDSRYKAEMAELRTKITKLEAERARAASIVAALEAYVAQLSAATGAAFMPWVLAPADYNVAYIQLVKESQQQTIAEQTALIQEIDPQLTAARQRLAWLEETVSQADDLENKLAQAVANLAQIRIALDAANAQFLQMLTHAPPGAMAAVARDRRGLATTGALLDFTAPRGDVRLTETCEGNVLLTYFDTAGRMRSTVYDAVADSRNATFEQWLPDGARACVDVQEPNRYLVVEPAVTLPPAGWTCEAWIRYPFPTRTVAFPGRSTSHGVPYDDNVLACSSDGAYSPLLIRKGNRLGLRVDGWFFDGGADLDKTLADGWHHFAISTSRGNTCFYVDGVEVGRRATLQPVMRFGVLPGKDDRVTVPNLDTPARLTLSVWARSSGTTWNEDACLVEKPGSFSLRFVKGQTLRFELVTTGTTVALEHEIPDTDAWHQYTGVFDGKAVRLHVDGEVVAERALSGSLAGGRGAMTIGAAEGGAAGVVGDIAEVALWNVGRDVPGVRGGVFEDLLPDPSGTADAPGLVGYWRMARSDVEGASRVKDLTSSARHGDVSGAPIERPITTLQSMEVRVLGNAVPPLAGPIGHVAEVRLWSLGLSKAEIAAEAVTVLTGDEPGLLAYWPLDEAGGNVARDRVGADQPHDAILAVESWAAFGGRIGNPGTLIVNLPDASASVKCNFADTPEHFTFECWVRLNVFSNCQELGTVAGQSVPLLTERDGSWHHWCATYERSGGVFEVVLYLDGQPLDRRNVPAAPVARSIVIGGQDTGFEGEVAEVHLWRGVRDPRRIHESTRRRCSGVETDLLVCLALDGATSDRRVTDRVSGEPRAELTGGARLLRTMSLPVTGSDRLVVAEYSSMEISVEHKMQPLMRRFFAFTSGGATHLVPELRVEELVLQWIGNTQINPTLLGYIEGAPPVPSENMTLAEDYDLATRVVLSQSDDVIYRWHRNETTGTSFTTDGFVGAAWSVQGGAFIQTKITDGQIGGVFNLAAHDSQAKDSAVSASSSLRATDALSLTGMLEDKATFSRLGRRWVPKNVGYALVISGTADVFATTLKRSGRMVSYEVRPLDGVPLDVNIVSFLINPAYTLNGSLDGMVGSMPAHPRLYAHVPEMRAHYGSRYPASYMKIEEAYSLKDKIDRQDKERESFFYNFDASDTSAMKELGDEPVDVPTLGQGSSDASATSSEADLDAMKEGAAQQKQESKDEADRRKSEIDQRQKSLSGRVRAGAAFAGWQAMMENIQTRAGKRNVVNTYVWDADGGLRAEEEGFAGTVEHSISTDSSLNWGAGASVDTVVTGFKFALSLVGSGSSSSSSGKTLTMSKSLELVVDLFGVEKRGITDLNDNPLVPGEKVGAYRFMTFYLEGSTGHFDDFFGRVVDPEWLASNDEDARALRQAQRGKPNKCWRVLHRVTYVKRPALAAVGERARGIATTSEVTDSVTTYFAELDHQQQRMVARMDQMQSTLDEILLRLKGA